MSRDVIKEARAQRCGLHAWKMLTEVHVLRGGSAIIDEFQND